MVGDEDTFSQRELNGSTMPPEKEKEMEEKKERISEGKKETQLSPADSSFLPN